MNAPRVKTQISNVIRQGQAPEFIVPQRRTSPDKPAIDPPNSLLQRRMGVKKPLSKQCESIDNQCETFMERLTQSLSGPKERPYAYQKPRKSKADTDLLNIRCSAVNVTLHASASEENEPFPFEDEEVKIKSRKRSDSDLSNYDSRAQGALGLRHLRNKTEFGFDTLNQRPVYSRGEFALQQMYKHHSV